ncbi:hypothetical protein [Accumulibacter sp.]|nr:hypothetical protein [Accumulibacter sp.]
MLFIEPSTVAIDPPMATVGDWMIFAGTWIISTEALISPIDGR